MTTTPSTVYVGDQVGGDPMGNRSCPEASEANVTQRKRIIILRRLPATD